MLVKEKRSLEQTVHNSKETDAQPCTTFTATLYCSPCTDQGRLRGFWGGHKISQGLCLLAWDIQGHYMWSAAHSEGRVGCKWYDLYGPLWGHAVLSCSAPSCWGVSFVQTSRICVWVTCRIPVCALLAQKMKKYIRGKRRQTLIV